MKKRFLIIGGAMVLVLLLGAAAFIGGRLLNGQGLPLLSSGGPSIGIAYGGHSITLRILPAKNFPTRPDLKGAFDHRQNNNIFVGTGSQSAVPQNSQSGSVDTTTGFSGPIYEVVVTSQTTIYRDDTLDQYNGTLHSGEKIQQVVEPGSLDEIGQDSEITVWGQKTGDRIIATVLVYTLPTVLNP
jgi:hypothetical protein